MMGMSGGGEREAGNGQSRGWTRSKGIIVRVPELGQELYANHLIFFFNVQNLEGLAPFLLYRGRNQGSWRLRELPRVQTWPVVGLGSELPPLLPGNFSSYWWLLVQNIPLAEGDHMCLGSQITGWKLLQCA